MNYREKITQELTDNSAAYSGMTDQQVVDELLLVDKPAKVNSVGESAFKAALDPDEFGNLTSTAIAKLNFLTQDGKIDLADANILADVEGVLPTNSVSFPIISALGTKTVNTAVLIGLGNMHPNSVLGLVTVIRSA